MWIKLTSEVRTTVSDINRQELSNHMAESETERGSKDVTQTQQRPESPTVTLTWHASQAKVHKLHQSTTVTLTWHASQAKVHKLHQLPTVTLTWHASQANVHKHQKRYTLHPRCTSGGLYVLCIYWHAM